MNKKLIMLVSIPLSFILGGAANASAEYPFDPGPPEKWCDAYSQRCVTPPPVLDVTEPKTAGQTPRGPVETKNTLPVTGAELTLLALAGMGVAVAGTVMVVASRKK